MINGINKKRNFTNFKSVKVMCFKGATIDDMNLKVILLSKKIAALVSHACTNNPPNETF